MSTKVQTPCLNLEQLWRIHLALNLFLWFLEVLLQLHHGSTSPFAKSHFPHFLQVLFLRAHSPVDLLCLQIPIGFAFLLPPYFFSFTLSLISAPAHWSPGYFWKVPGTHLLQSISTHTYLCQEYCRNTLLLPYILQLQAFKVYPSYST